LARIFGVLERHRAAGLQLANFGPLFFFLLSGANPLGNPGLPLVEQRIEVSAKSDSGDSVRRTFCPLSG